MQVNPEDIINIGGSQNLLNYRGSKSENIEDSRGLAVHETAIVGHFVFQELWQWHIITERHNTTKFWSLHPTSPINPSQ